MAWRQNFVRKKRMKNVDEIDGSTAFFHKSVIVLLFYSIIPCRKKIGTKAACSRVGTFELSYPFRGLFCPLLKTAILILLKGFQCTLLVEIRTLVA